MDQLGLSSFYLPTGNSDPILVQEADGSLTKLSLKHCPPDVLMRFAQYSEEIKVNPTTTQQATDCALFASYANLTIPPPVLTKCMQNGRRLPTARTTEFWVIINGGRVKRNVESLRTAIISMIQSSAQPQTQANFANDNVIGQVRTLAATHRCGMTRWNREQGLAAAAAGRVDADAVNRNNQGVINDLQAEVNILNNALSIARSDIVARDTNISFYQDEIARLTQQLTTSNLRHGTATHAVTMVTHERQGLEDRCRELLRSNLVARNRRQAIANVLGVALPTNLNAQFNNALNNNDPNYQNPNNVNNNALNNNDPNDQNPNNVNNNDQDENMDENDHDPNNQNPNNDGQNPDDGSANGDLLPPHQLNNVMEGLDDLGAHLDAAAAQGGGQA